MNNHEIDIHTAIMDVITDVWDREKQINEATYEILDLIEADRKKFGRNDNDRGNDNDYCKRRGEPVAKVRDRGFEVVDGKHVPTVLVEFPVDDWESRDRFAAAVDTPQPLSESDMSDETDLVRCAECGAEMIQVRPGKWQHPDCSQSSWAAELVGGLSAEQLAKILAEYIKPEIIGEALEKLENAPWGLSEPVKVDAEASVPIDDLAHEIWAAAQTAPGEGIVDAVERIAALLARYSQST